MGESWLPVPSVRSSFHSDARFQIAAVYPLPLTKPPSAVTASALIVPLWPLYHFSLPSAVFQM